MRFVTAIRVGAQHAVPLLVACAALAADEPQVVTPPASSTFNAFTQFAQVLKTLQEHYIDPGKISSGQSVTTALRGFVRTLDADAELYAPGELDPPADELVDFGARLVWRNGHPTVVSPRDGTTAQQAGLLSGEQIVAINDNPTANLRLIEVERQLRGRVGDNCLLRVLDPGTGVREIVVRRVAPAAAGQVGIRFLSGGVGYVRLGAFSPETANQLAEILNAPVRQRPSALILDLRNNHGVRFPTVQLTAQLFLPAGAEVLALDYPRSQRRATFVSKTKTPFTGPLVVLINAGTAEAAEVFAASLRDHQRARLVGTTTFGLGRQFQSFPLPDGSQLSLPVAFYLPPSKKPYHTTGVEPDVVVPLERDVERQLATAGFGHFTSPRAQKDSLARDRQLAKALELLTK